MTKASVAAVCVAVALTAAAAGRAEAQSVRVAGFTPSENGFGFYNGWPQMPYGGIPVGLAWVPWTSASAGMCGGMVFAARDYWESGYHVPLSFHNPAYNTVLYNYLSGRLFDSFTPAMVARLYGLQSSFWDDDRRGAMRQDWPLIKADLDGGKLSPMQLVRLRSDPSPFDLGRNHQVLAYGYDLGNGGTLITIHIYDPDHNGDDTVTITLDLANNAAVRQSTNEPLYAFFREDYAPKTPPATTTWRNGFEGADETSWFTSGDAGVEDGYGTARTGAGDGWVVGANGWNSVDHWVPLNAGHACAARAYVQTSYYTPLAAYLTMRDAATMDILPSEVAITSPWNDALYHLYQSEFTAEGATGLFYVGMWGVPAGLTWLRFDDALVVCQTW